MKCLTKSFVASKANKFVYYPYGVGVVILCLYVNDILIFGTNLSMIGEVKDLLSKRFDMEGLRVANVILIIQLLKEQNGGVTLM
jgi:hypothetical protein